MYNIRQLTNLLHGKSYRKTIILDHFIIIIAMQKWERYKIRFWKKISKFNPSDFSNLNFHRLYVLEGVYFTKRDFEINLPKMDGTDSSTDYLYFYKNGNASFFVAENLDRAEFLIKQIQGIIMLLF